MRYYWLMNNKNTFDAMMHRFRELGYRWGGWQQVEASTNSRYFEDSHHPYLIVDTQTKSLYRSRSDTGVLPLCVAGIVKDDLEV